MKMLENNLHLTNPISANPFYVLIETGGSHVEHDQEKLTLLLEHLMEEGKATDGTLATETRKIQVII